MSRQVSGHFKCHKEALVLGYPDSPALDWGCLFKGTHQSLVLIPRIQASSESFQARPLPESQEASLG